MEKKSIKINRTNNGVPSLWESYREFENLKRKVCVFNENGDKLDCIYSKYDNSCLVPLRENYLILKIFSDEIGIGITLLRVDEIDRYSNNCIVSVIRRIQPNTIEWLLNENTNDIDTKVLEKINKVVENNVF